MKLRDFFKRKNIKTELPKHEHFYYPVGLFYKQYTSEYRNILDSVIVCNKHICVCGKHFDEEFEERRFEPSAYALANSNCLQNEFIKYIEDNGVVKEFEINIKADKKLEELRNNIKN